MSTPVLQKSADRSDAQPLAAATPWYERYRAVGTVACVVIMLVIAFLLPHMVDRPRFWLPNIGVKTAWLGVMGLSLVFLNKYLGLLSLVQAAIGGSAAYGVAYFVVKLKWSPIAAIAMGLLVGVILAVLTALITSRTKAIYFLMITLAIEQVIYSWASQSMDITNGRRGLAPVKRPDLGIVDLSNLTTFYYTCVVLALLCYLGCRYVGSSPFGLTLLAIKDSPERTAALGFTNARYRLLAIAFAGLIASIGGVIMAWDRMQVDPSAVSLPATLDVLIVAVIGGSVSLGGPFLGGLALTLLMNFSNDITERYLTLTGAVFVLILLFMPTGLAGIPGMIRRGLSRLRQRDRAVAHPTTDAPEPATASSERLDGEHLSVLSQDPPDHRAAPEHLATPEHPASADNPAPPDKGVST